MKQGVALWNRGVALWNRWSLFEIMDNKVVALWYFFMIETFFWAKVEVMSKEEEEYYENPELQILWHFPRMGIESEKIMTLNFVCHLLILPVSFIYSIIIIISLCFLTLYRWYMYGTFIFLLLKCPLVLIHTAGVYLFFNSFSSKQHIHYVTMLYQTNYIGI